MKPKADLFTSLDRQSIIVQKYISKPLLLENKKFDIRCFLFVSYFDPLVAFFHHGYIRKSIMDYNPEDFINKAIHCVN